MNKRKLLNFWKNIRPAVIVLALILCVIVFYVKIRPSKINSIEKYQYKDKVTTQMISNLKTNAHLHQVSFHHDRYTGVIPQLVTKGAYKNVKFEADYYKSKNVLDLTPLNAKAGYQLWKEHNTHNKSSIDSATDVANGVLQYDVNLKKTTGDPSLGVQLTVHTPHNQIPILFSVNNGKKTYSQIKTGKLIHASHLI